MSREFSIKEAQAAACEAFAPYQDKVRLTEEGTGYRLQVLDNQGEAGVDIDTISTDDLRDRKRLNGILSFARDRLAANGFSLQPWDPTRQP